MRKIWLPFLAGFIVYGAMLLGSDHTGNQERQSEPVVTTTTGSTVLEAFFGGSPPPMFVPTTTTSTTSAPTPTVVEVVEPSGDDWYRLFGCETGYTYNPRIVSKSGKYRGAFQFDLQTWQAVGEVGDPIDYPYEHQLAAAKRLHQQRGWSPWPHCSNKLGLR